MFEIVTDDGSIVRRILPTGNLATYQKAVAIAEQFFEADWLKAELLSKKSSKWKHIIPEEWFIAKSYEVQMMQRMTSRSVAFTPGVRSDYFAQSMVELDGSSVVPFFDKNIRKRILSPVECEKALYEARLAYGLLTCGYPTEFVPESKIPNTKTPDLIATTSSGTILFECKRKDKFSLPKKPDQKQLQYISRFLDSVVETLRNSGGDLALIVFAPGQPSPETIKYAESVVPDVVSRGSGTVKLYRDEGFAVGLTGFPQEAKSTLEQGELLVPSGYAYGVSKADISPIRHDEALYRNPAMALIDVIDSHKTQSVLDSFRTARSQITTGSPGVIYIDVDISHLFSRQVETYLNMLGIAFAQCFTPDKNTRISAIVITAERTEFVPKSPFCPTGLVATRLAKAVANPHASAPIGPGIRLPI